MRVFINPTRVDVVGGPGHGHLSNVSNKLADDPGGRFAQKGIPTRFTIDTGADNAIPIRVTVCVRQLSKESETRWYYCGTLSKDLVEGYYDPESRVGSMEDYVTP